MRVLTRSLFPGLRALVALFGASSLASCSPPVTPAQIDKLSAQCRASREQGGAPPLPAVSVFVPSQLTAAGEPVVIYGASWCVACRVAKLYLARVGIPFVERDVEEDPSAAEARDRTLESAGLEHTNSIPIIDVRGTVMTGFDACAIEAAWSRDADASTDGG